MERIKNNYIFYFKIVKDFFRNIKFFFRNLFWFRKQLWNYRDWDYTYTLELLSFSLEKQKNCLMHSKLPGINDSVKISALNECIEILKSNQLEDKNNPQWHRLWNFIDSDMREWWD